MSLPPIYPGYPIRSESSIFWVRHAVVKTENPAQMAVEIKRRLEDQFAGDVRYTLVTSFGEWKFGVIRFGDTPLKTYIKSVNALLSEVRALGLEINLL